MLARCSSDGGINGRIVDGSRFVKKWKYAEEQIAFVLERAETGSLTADLRHKIRIQKPTFYGWKICRSSWKG